ncbi:hypothetical protein C8T65DRAFT_737484 [Cerioporus squamosus]|nr:hypothetical protein C8T65DRAFT_737484 [Cerioporus squamosus]
MSATVSHPSGSDSLRIVPYQFSPAVQDLEYLVGPDAHHTVSDEEIDSVRELSHRTNSLSFTGMTDARRGANRLPTELLRVIFLQALRPVDLSRIIAVGSYWRERPDYSIDLGWPNEHKRMCDVLALAHVCQYWRSVALGFPELWQSVAMSRQDAASAFLARAGEKPLSVLATATGSGIGWFKEMQARCAPTVKQLLWVAPARPRHPATRQRQFVQSELCIVVAPMLERLCIARGIRADGSYSAPRVVFRGDTSGVKYLSLIEYHWFPVGQFPALTHLILATKRIYPLRMSVFLNGCRQLQTLICRTPESWEESVPMHIIRLPHLRRISLECANFPEDYLYRFLAKLDFDRSRAAIRVSFKNHGDGNRDLRKLLVAPPPLQTTLGPQFQPHAPYTHLCIKNVRPPQGGDSSFTVFVTSTTGGVCLKGLSAIQHVVQHSFPLQDVSELWIDGLAKELPEVLRVWKRALSALRTVVIVRRPLPPGTEVREDVLTGSVGCVEDLSKFQRAWRGEPIDFGPDLASMEMGMRILEQWDSEDAVFERVKAIFGNSSVPGAQPVRIFASDGKGSIQREEMGSSMTATTSVGGVTPLVNAGGEETEEMPTTMLLPEVCRVDPELTAWEAW